MRPHLVFAGMTRRRPHAILRVHGMPVPGPWRRPGPHPRPRPTRRHERRQSGTGLPARPSPQTRRRVAVVPTRTRLFLLGQPLGGICHTQPPPIIEDLPDPQPGLPYPAYVPLATSRDYRSCNVHHLSRTLHLRLHAIRSIPTNRRRSRCAADRAVRAGRPGGDAWSARVSALGAKPTRAAGKNSEVPRCEFSVVVDTNGISRRPGVLFPMQDHSRERDRRWIPQRRRSGEPARRVHPHTEIVVTASGRRSRRGPRHRWCTSTPNRWPGASTRPAGLRR
jgi:hypothetical protein